MVYADLHQSRFLDSTDSVLTEGALQPSIPRRSDEKSQHTLRETEDREKGKRGETHQRCEAVDSREKDVCLGGWRKEVAKRREKDHSR